MIELQNLVTLISEILLVDILFIVVSLKCPKIFIVKITF